MATKDDIPEGSVKAAEIRITHYLSPEMDPIIAVSIEGSNPDELPPFLETIGMYHMAEGTIEAIYASEGTESGEEKAS